TALGKAILSILDTERLDSLIANLKMKKITQYTVTDPVELMKKIDSVRDRGYSIDREEFDDGLVCVAVPIKISELGFIGGISISGPINRFDDERGHFLAQKLLETRNEILDTLHHELGGFND
ncbi:MAG: IclR family transcriptional regulator C-terminal domain-containing protein, partial [Spirochaetes bacterium]|nr:IclR family transcriptional regulator C-terminal domain-containing protein [Spirochaetota bacterium]